MQTENLSPQDSLKLIQNMIRKAQYDMSDNSIHFLLWGWITFIACVSQFVLLKVFDCERHYLVWLLIIPGIIVSTYLGIKEERKRRVNTYISDSMKNLWMGMGISFFVLSMILSKLGWNHTIFPFFILLYGLGTFVSGKILQFKPLVSGGLSAWALAIISVYFGTDDQILFGAAAILLSYLIPAYMLRRKTKLSRNQE